VTERAGSDPIVVDARGLRCPIPVIRLAQAAHDLPEGTEITVLATDPAAAHDVPAWCAMRGHEWLGPTPVPPDAEGLALRVRLRHG
jgi:tRNA 2-thiouridine synthesizing protein A